MTDKERFFDKISLTHPPGGCWIWQAQKDRDGYGRFQYEDRPQNAARVAYQLFVGMIPSGLFVLHKCDVRPCVNPNHLYLGTQKDNLRDMTNRKRNQRGESHCNAKFTESQVLAIRDDKHNSIPFLATKYGVSYGAIYHIKKRDNWKHI